MFGSRSVRASDGPLAKRPAGSTEQPPDSGRDARTLPPRKATITAGCHEAHCGMVRDTWTPSSGIHCTVNEYSPGTHRRTSIHDSGQLPSISATVEITEKDGVYTALDAETGERGTEESRALALAAPAVCLYDESEIFGHVDTKPRSNSSVVGRRPASTKRMSRAR